MICPFCHFERGAEVSAVPDWKCPNCERAYKKYEPENTTATVFETYDHEVEASLAALRVPIFWVWIGMGMLLTYIYDIEDGKDIAFSFKYLLVPIFLCLFLVMLLLMPATRRKMGEIRIFLWSGALALLLTFSSAGFVLAFNAHIGSKEYLLIEGEILGKSISGAKADYRIRVLRKGVNESVELKISNKEYKKLVKNDMYSERWAVGSLGILYKVTMSLTRQ